MNASINHLIVEYSVVACGFSTAKSKAPPQEIFSIHLTGQSVGPNHSWPLVIENWFLF